MPLESGPSEQPVCPNCHEPYNVYQLRAEWSFSEIEAGARVTCRNCSEPFQVTAHASYSTEIIKAP